MDIDTVFLLVTLAVSGAGAAFAFWRRYLTMFAALISVGFALLLVSVTGWPWALTVASAFIVTSWLSSIRSRKAGQARHPPRDVGQLLANSVVIILLTLGYGIVWPGSPLLLAAFLGCVAAVSGDTWASSVPRLSTQQPWSLRTGKRVAIGTPGAVTLMGLLLSACAGVFAIGCYWAFTSYFSYWPGSSERLQHLMIAAVLGGLLGALADSWLGTFCQALYRRADGGISDNPNDADGRPSSYLGGWRWLSNDIVNLLNSICGAAAAAAYWYLLAS
jgi:uncharacterized membrane protein